MDEEGGPEAAPEQVGRPATAARCHVSFITTRDRTGGAAEHGVHPEPAVLVAAQEYWQQGPSQRKETEPCGHLHGTCSLRMRARAWRRDAALNSAAFDPHGAGDPLQHVRHVISSACDLAQTRGLPPLQAPGLGVATLAGSPRPGLVKTGVKAGQLASPKAKLGSPTAKVSYGADDFDRVADWPAASAEMLTRRFTSGAANHAQEPEAGRATLDGSHTAWSCTPGRHR
eukprot:354084-Chlamydomonas_euryale.AAC.3